MMDDEIEAGEAFRDLPGLALPLAFSCLRTLTSSIAEKNRTLRRGCLMAWVPSGCDMGSARARTADQHDVLGRINEVASMLPVRASLISLMARSKPETSL